jgi:lysozyme family protein
MRLEGKTVGGRVASFDQSIGIVLEHEGGYQDNPSDLSHGATNMGITQKDLSEYLKRTATKDDVKMLLESTAKEIYRVNYWDMLHLDYLDSQKLATVILDMAVVRGMIAVTKDLQGILKVTINGVMSGDMLSEVNNLDEIAVAIDLIKVSQKAFCHICSFNRNQIVFLNGWINRTHSLLDYVLDL